jgi:hypothetical protein
MLYRAVLFVLYFVITSQYLFSQEVRGAVGRWPIVNITPEQARSRAIEEAKKEALRIAGIEETVKATDMLSTIDANDRHIQMFSSFSSIELYGAVTDYTIVRNKQEKNSVDGNFYAEVTIDAKVKRYHTMADPEFNIEVIGLRNNGYRQGEPIAFSVRPQKDGYLKIFLFEESENAIQVFPNNYEPNRKFEAGKRIDFPVTGIDYTVQKNTNKPIEHNWLLFVYTKHDIPFYEIDTYPHILNWVNRMEPNERKVVVKNILITE